MKNNKLNKIFSRSKELITDNERLKGLITTVKNKLEEVNLDPHQRISFINQIRLVIRMIQAHLQGRYRAFSFQTLLLLVFSLVYFITPVDLVPDFIPALGLADDISILYMILRSISEDIEKYRIWEGS